MRDGVSYVNLHRPSQRGRCGSSGFLPHPPEPEQSLAVVRDRRGEGDDPAAARGLPDTLRTGRLDAPMLAPAEPRWARLRSGLEPGVNLRDRFRGALIGGAIGDAMGRANEGVRPSEARKRQIQDYQPWHGWRSGPKGTITDDTQMTMWLAEAILGASHEPRERAEGQRGAGAGEQGRRGQGEGKRTVRGARGEASS